MPTKTHDGFTTFAFVAALGDRVWVTDLEQWCIVQAILVNTLGITYELAWFNSGDRKTAYVFDHEFKTEQQRRDERRDDGKL